MSLPKCDKLLISFSAWLVCNWFILVLFLSSFLSIGGCLALHLVLGFFFSSIESLSDYIKWTPSLIFWGADWITSRRRPWHFDLKECRIKYTGVAFVSSFLLKFFLVHSSVLSFCRVWFMPLDIKSWCTALNAMAHTRGGKLFRHENLIVRRVYWCQWE